MATTPTIPRYGVKAVTNTIWGEGQRTGQRSVVVAFTDCNLWDGHPLHRSQGQGGCAMWCDADFFRGEVLSLPDLLGRMEAAWPRTEALPDAHRWCVLTGGEPLLQVTDVLLECLHVEGWKVAVETNGTLAHPILSVVDHLCVSPKRGTKLVVRAADELKVIVPGAVLLEPGWSDDDLVALEKAGTWGALYVQPQDVLTNPAVVDATVLRGGSAATEEVNVLLEHVLRANTQMAVSFVLRHPAWRLSAQVHKLVGLA